MLFKGLPNGYKLIECENLTIAASCNDYFEQNQEIKKEVYHPTTILVYIEQGSLEVLYENKVHLFPQGSICLCRKYTHVFVSKAASKKKEDQVKSYSFMMPDVFLRKIIANFKFDKDLEPLKERLFELSPTKKLKTVMQTMKLALENEDNLNIETLETNIQEALRAIFSSNPKLAILFKEFSLAKRADLNLFMNTNYKMPVTVKVLAEMSGRSLSTFTREFKLIFGTTPHKWILKKRLQLAYKLLAETSKNVSEVYLEAGFEDLAHFSKVFKKEYRKNPSTIKQYAKTKLLNTNTIYTYSLN